MITSPYNIIHVVCRVTGVSKNEIKSSVYGTGKQDCQNCIDARRLAIFLIKKYNPDLPHSEIALMFNKRLKTGKGDHVISLHCCKMAQNYIDTNDSRFLTLYGSVLKKIDGKP